MHFYLHFKIRTPAQVDEFISAELPDKEQFPKLWNLVASKMIHKCNKISCCKTGQCEKRFPKDYQETTDIAQARYPIYRRRPINAGYYNDDFITSDKVIPYNAYLLERYECHINVEHCAGVKAIKYLYKYIYKGPARVKIDVNGHQKTALREYFLFDYHYIIFCYSLNS